MRPPLSIRVHSSPVTSDSKKPASLGNHAGNGRDALTPPSSPHAVRSHRAHPVSSPNSNRSPEGDSIAESDNNAASGVKTFPFHIFDYDTENASQLGSGLWSTVYMAHSTSPTLSHEHLALSLSSLSSALPSSALTPPSTPNGVATPKAPLAYAIKVPTRKDAIAVLLHEARILTHLAASPNAIEHVITFFGHDRRNDALVLEAVPTSLERWTQDCESLDESSRAWTMHAAFRSLSLSLVQGLAWLHEQGVVHADIKPANILLRGLDRRRKPASDVFQDKSNADAVLPHEFLYCPVYIDFSASVLEATPADMPSSAAAGGGTWDFLAPEILSSPSPPPTRASDVYALAITLLWTLTGRSPFADAPNAFLRRDMIKQGRAWDYAAASDVGSQRISALVNRGKSGNGNTESKFDVKSLIGMALKKDVEKRITSRDWSVLVKDRLGDRAW